MLQAKMMQPWFRFQANVLQDLFLNYLQVLFTPPIKLIFIVELIYNLSKIIKKLIPIINIIKSLKYFTFNNYLL